jgi:arylsulfatase A-like enzyme
MVLGFITLLSFSAEARQPNVVIIYTDDQGSVDMGAYGADDLKTPAMDRLASEGIRFTQFYSAAPVCSPSRAAMLTGRYNIRAGVPGNVSSTKGEPGMPSEQITLAEMFKAGGYATAHIGKWHLGFSEDTMPNAQGFDYSFGHMGGCIDNYSHYFYWNGPNRHDLHRNGVEVFEDGKFFPDLMVEETERFVREHTTDPFFIYFAMNAPHYPYQGETDWLEYYQKAGVASPRDLYAAFLSTQDERIGKLLELLDELSLTENTIVIFQSDNGHSTEERAHFGGGSAGPYRGAKFSLFEGGIRLPAIIRWPGSIESGGVRSQMVHACDWMPTLANLCGIPLLDQDIDGKSMLGILADPDADSPHEVLHWQVGLGQAAQWAVRDGDWKLIGNPADTSNGHERVKVDNKFLVNLAEDISEQSNLLDKHPDIAKRLESLHTSWISGILNPDNQGKASE